MGSIRSDCPHNGCRTKNVSFETIASSILALGQNNHPHDVGAIYNLFATCTACRGGVVFEMEIIQYDAKLLGGLEKYQSYEIEKTSIISAIWPKPEANNISNNVPQPVAKAVAEADANYDDGRWSSASASYRMALERSLKIIGSSGSGSLYKRIESMQGRLPNELIELLHEVRFLGNDAVHEIDDPEKEDVLLGRKFAHLFLTYVFELPAQIIEAKMKRGVLPHP